MLISSLDNLMGILESKHGRKVVALIDEYDSPVNESYGKPCQREILDFMRGFHTSALKGNSSLRLGVVTGIMQIAKESIFSGLNNLKVNNIVSTDMDEAFGFTPAEWSASAPTWVIQRGSRRPGSGTTDTASESPTYTTHGAS